MTAAAIFLICFYFLPTLVAAMRSHNVGGVFLVNLFFGWSVVGWFVAFVMASGARQRVVVVNQINQAVYAPPPQPQLAVPAAREPSQIGHVSFSGEWRDTRAYVDRKEPRS